MKKSEAVTVMNAELVNGEFSAEELYTREETEKVIRKISRKKKGFEDVVFELGVSTLAKAYMKDNK